MNRVNVVDLFFISVSLQHACNMQRRGTIPKFATANGNWIGQLPEELREMTFGSRFLIHPIHSFGRVAAFHKGGGSRLTSHMYSNKLNTPFVWNKLPINPAEVRAIVMSPLASVKL